MKDRTPLLWAAGALLVSAVFLFAIHQRARTWEGFAGGTTTADAVLQEWLQSIASQQQTVGDGQPEVFQVGPDKFTYDAAQERCVRYGGRLATLDEVKQAFAKGAHWCRQGWIAGGKVAVVKGVPDHELLEEGCPKGERGVYTETYPAAVRFAATCYGPRPKPGLHWRQEVERRRKAMEAERVRREAEASVQFAATLRQQIERDQRVRDDMMRDDIAPFNGKDLIWGQSAP